MRVRMFSNHESVGGIKTVISNYYKYMPKLGVKFVDDEEFDLAVVHAGSAVVPKNIPLVAMLHGLYWGDDIDKWQRKSNRNIVSSIHQADEITVPSYWVAETLERDLRIKPHVIPHGIDTNEWDNKEESRGYVLWNKAVQNAVNDPAPVIKLSQDFPHIAFVTTFAKNLKTKDNLNVIGRQDYEIMKVIVKRAGVYLSTTKETFGIGTLEAMAAGVPILGWCEGGNKDLVQHGVNGYLAQKDNYIDLVSGLEYCLKHRDILGANSRKLAENWSWESACQKVYNVWKKALEPKPPTVSIIIPVYNKSKDQITRAVNSALSQTYKPEKVIVVNDGSTTFNTLKDLDFPESDRLHFVEQNNRGVAHARNNGIKQTNSKYITCLDADDWIDENYLASIIPHLEADKQLGIAYTRLMTHTENNAVLSEWPKGDQDYDKQINYNSRLNHVPTCCVFRRGIWERVGGFRQRYAPKGCGSEDAAFWTMFGALGFTSRVVDDRPLFNYTAFQGGVSEDGYVEPDWLKWYPWSRHKVHPFASIATPSNMSHTVREYDNPVISVIIPVGPKHEHHLIDCLDSLESQKFWNWEAIVVNDTGKNIDELLVPYPYVKLVNTEGGRGAGYARNRGCEIARSYFLLFLDVDDAFNVMHDDVLDLMIAEWNQTMMATYTDFIGRAIVDNPDQLSKQIKNNIIAIDEKDNEIFYKSELHDYDCNRAIKQPDISDSGGNTTYTPYVWNLINTLFPKSWHFEIGGFDENMETLEDWDYWIRMAKNGKCFAKINKHLFLYRYHTGNRRELANNRQIFQNVIKYMVDKHRKLTEVKMCNCNKRKKRKPNKLRLVNNTNGIKVNNKGNDKVTVPDDNYVKCRYVGAGGKHSVFGYRHTPKGRGELYGYHTNGDIFYVSKADIEYENHQVKVNPRFRRKFEPVQDSINFKEEEKEAAPQVVSPPPVLVNNPIESPQESDEPIVKNISEGEMLASDFLFPMNTGKSEPLIIENKEETQPPTLIDNDDKENEIKVNVHDIPGVSSRIADEMVSLGLETVNKIREAGEDGLVEIPGIGKQKAKIILAYVDTLI